MPAGFPPCGRTAASSAPSSGDVHDHDIGPNDVLCGRGGKSNHNPGNAAFLGIVQSYLSGYVSAKTRKEKQRIAAQVVHHVRNCVDPPGRFLVLTDGSDKMWHIVDDDVALERVKQALRNQKKEWDKPKREQKSGPVVLDREGPENEHERQRIISTGVSMDGDNSLSDDLGEIVDASIEPLAIFHPERPLHLTLAAAPGKSGKEENKRNQRGKLLDSVRIASGFVRKLCDAHDAGTVAYESNVGVDGFHLSGKLIRRDLVSLGSDLYRHFAGVDPFDASRASAVGVEEARTALEESSILEEAALKKKERRLTSQKYDLLRDLGLPISLCILVSSLMDAEDESATDRYKTADEAEEDLSLMIADPERYLFDADSNRVRGELVFSDDKLYGREYHLSCMIEVFKRATESTSGPLEVLLISGYSGTGKSALVEQLRGPLLQKNGYFISGKFDQLGQAQPMSVIFDAFNEYCHNITEGNDETLYQTRRAIREALGPNGNVLTDLIPNLSKVIGVPTTEAIPVGGRAARNRFLFYFRLFVQAASSPSHPVILFLDDLQWVDKASLDLISTIVSDSEINSLFFIGCYRDNEVSDDHPLNLEIDKLALAGVRISNIKLENIDRKSVNALVSDTLYLSPRITWPLGDIVYNKTSGNPLFAMQFLRSIYNNHLLHYSANSRRWEWDVEAIQSKDIADNVVDLMARKILSFGSEMQWLLKVAACLGSQCEPPTLELLGSDVISEELGVVLLLDFCVREGVMCKLGSIYKFSHDQIQQAAYTLIAVSEREALHLHIGRSLLKRASKEELERLIFVVVDQLQRGSILISDHNEKVKIARLCLTAGEKAMSSSAFEQASIYLLQGSVLLQESDWEDHYDLSLQLFSCCAEVQYAIGNYDALAITVSPIFAHGRCLQDKLWAIGNQLRSIGGQGKHLDALNFGLDVLLQLGESFPSDIDDEIVKLDFAKTKEMCQGTTIEEVLKKESMADANKISAMKLLATVSLYAHQSKPYLCLLMTFRMVQLTMCHGISRDSPFAFAVLGVTVIRFGELEQGYSYGKLAVSLLDILDAKEKLAQVYAVVYVLINIFSEPLQASLPSLLHGYKVGMSTGDFEHGLLCAVNYCKIGIMSGRKLDTLVAEVQKCVQQMRDYKQSTSEMAVPWLQALLNLTGNAEDPTKLTGEAMNQEEVLLSALEKHNDHVVAAVNQVRLWLNYLFRRYDDAAELADCHQMTSKTPLRLLFSVHQTFYTGLVAMERSHKNEGKEWRSIARESLEKVKVWARNSAWNYQHKLDLLNAEMAYLNGDRDKAAQAYDDAIRNARKHGFVHEEALACERAGLFHSVVSAATAAEYFEKARRCYLAWGATRKARDLPSTCQLIKMPS